MDKKSEWLEADGLGGFASGTVAGIRTRRYHALLLTATTPPTGRLVLVNGFDAWVETPSGTFALSSQAYPPDVIHPDGEHRIQSFEADPWPRWIFHLEDGTRITHEIFVPHDSPVVAISWRLLEPGDGVTLSVRPFFSGRDYHALHHENQAFRFEPRSVKGRLMWHPYDGLPGIVAVSNGNYTQQPGWYRNFLYEEERARGLDFTEDLASPGVFRWDLSKKEAVWILAAEEVEAKGKAGGLGLSGSAEVLFKNFRDSEAKRRRQFPTRLHRAADAYLVRTRRERVSARSGRAGQTGRGRVPARPGGKGEIGTGKTIIAGYPWFADWGRDTFISIRGLCLATGRLDEAREILLEWAGTVSEGMLPNRFPDQGDRPEFNSVDASLWYVIAVHEFLQATEAGKRKISPRDKHALQEATEAILAGYAKGTRYRIHLEDDGLLAAGQPGVQLTWMDAKVGDWVVTPRIGKPVEIQALWLNALKIGSGFSDRWNDVFVRGCETFRARFWNPAGKYLHDVVDADHEPGKVDPSFRPNQIFAVGGLPFSLLDGERARAVVEAVEARLWTPIGLRSLAPGEPGYVPRYQGGVWERDGAYHQGTVWPWLLGAFVEAWVRVRGSTLKAKRDAGVRYLDPLLRHLDEAGLSHISEIADADPPHTPRGCPFQAWSVGEALRLALVVLGDENQLPPRKKA